MNKLGWCLILLGVIWLSVAAFVRWHEHKKQQAFESVIVQGYRCDSNRCEAGRPVPHE